MSDASLTVPTNLSKPIIAIDIDDVLASSAKAFVEFSNERWGTNLVVDDYDENWARMWGLDNGDVENLKLISERSIDALSYGVPRMENIADAYDVLKKLGQHFTLIVVTSRRSELKAETLAWIQERYEGIFKEDKIFFTGFYDTINSASWNKSKGDILRELDVSYLVDDQVKHCNGAAEHGIKALQFGSIGPQALQPVHESVVRVKNWNEVAEFFDAERKRISN